MTLTKRGSDELLCNQVSNYVAQALNPMELEEGPFTGAGAVLKRFLGMQVNSSHGQELRRTWGRAGRAVLCQP